MNITRVTRWTYNGVDYPSQRAAIDAAEDTLHRELKRLLIGDGVSSLSESQVFRLTEILLKNPHVAELLAFTFVNEDET